MQRYNNLQRKARGGQETSSLLTKTLAELGTALEEVRVAQEQLVESRNRVHHLQGEVREHAERYYQLVDAMPDAYVVSKPDSTIVEANRAAAQLFNVSQRFLVGKPLSVFVCEDRAAFLAAGVRVATEAGGSMLELTLKLRPRERAPLAVAATVTGQGDSLRWVLRPAKEEAPPPASTL
jgi:PAS domain S-box-containing protein